MEKLKIYIIKFGDTSLVVSFETWEMVRAECRNLGTLYVHNNNGIGQELVIYL